MTLLRGKRRQELGGGKKGRREAGRIERKAAAFLFHLVRTVAEPGMAILDHCMIRHDFLRCLDDGPAQCVEGLPFGEERQRDIFIAGGRGETAQQVFGEAALAVIGIAVGMPQGDRVIERIGPVLHVDEADRRRMDEATLLDFEKRAFLEEDFRAVSIGGSCEHHILDGAAEADMHFAQVRIEAAKIARRVGENVDLLVA